MKYLKARKIKKIRQIQTKYFFINIFQKYLVVYYLKFFYF